MATLFLTSHSSLHTSYYVSVAKQNVYFLYYYSWAGCTWNRSLSQQTKRIIYCLLKIIIFQAIFLKIEIVWKLWLVHLTLFLLSMLMNMNTVYLNGAAALIVHHKSNNIIIGLITITIKIRCCAQISTKTIQQKIIWSTQTFLRIVSAKRCVW